MYLVGLIYVITDILKRSRLNLDGDYSQYQSQALESDTTPWEINTSDIGSQLVLLGVIPSHTGCAMDLYDLCSLGGNSIDSSSTMLSQDSQGIFLMNYSDKLYASDLML